MTAILLPNGKQQFFTNAGIPLAGGKVYTYAAGTNTPALTWADANQLAANTNPVILDARGEAAIFWNGTYKVVLQDALGNVIWTEDNVYAPDLAALFAAFSASLAATSTAGIIGFSHALTYPAATVGQALDQYKSVKDAPFNAVGDGSADDTAAIAAAILYKGNIFFPLGTYKCNIDLNGVTGVHLIGEAQGQGETLTAGTRLIPADATKPVLRIRDNCIDCGAENFLFDSKLDGTYSNTGTGMILSALSPNFVWRCYARHIFFRGFDRGFEISCDINVGEVFDNHFSDLECIGCTSYGFKTLGVYNVYDKLFATVCGDYAIYNEGSSSVFNSVVGDGRMSFRGGGQHVTNAVIEAIYGAGKGVGFPAFEVNGNNSTFDGIALTAVPSAKFEIGISAFGTQQNISNVAIIGTDHPSKTIVLQGGSSGNITNAVASGGSTIDANTTNTILGNWTFNGDVSTLYVGRNTWSPVLAPAGGSITATVNERWITKQGSRVFGSVKLTVSAVAAPTGALTISGLPYTAAAVGSVTIKAVGMDATTSGALQGEIATGDTKVTLTAFTGGTAADIATKVTATTVLEVAFEYFA